MEFQDNHSNSVPVLVDEYYRKASYEEAEGCFGTAEQLFTKSLHLAATHLPGSKLEWKALIDLALFKGRWLPGSEQPIALLRRSVEISSSSEDTALATLHLAKALISADCCREAEDLLRTLLATDLQVEICLGQIALQRGDVMRAEHILRDAVSRARTETTSLLFEALIHYGRVLMEKEQFEDSEGVLMEALTLSRGLSRQNFEFALNTLTKLHSKTRRLSQLKSTMEMFFHHSKRSNSTEFARCVELLGDAYAEGDHGFANNYYWDALRLYKSAKPISWRVAVMQMKLDFRGQCEKEFLDMLPFLPTVPVIICLHTHYASCSVQINPYIEKLLQLAEHSEPAVRGESLVALLHIAARHSQQIPSLQDRVEVFIRDNPHAKASLKLMIATRTSQLDALQDLLAVLRPADVSPIVLANVLSRLAEMKMKLAKSANSSVRTRLWDESVAHLKESLDYCPAASFVLGEKQVELGNVLQRQEQLGAASQYFKQAITSIETINPLSIRLFTAVAALVELLRSTKKVADVESTLLLYAGNCIRKHPTHSSTSKAVDKVLKFYSGHSANQEQFLMQYTDFCIKHDPGNPQTLKCINQLVDLFTPSNRFTELVQWLIVLVKCQLAADPSGELCIPTVRRIAHLHQQERRSAESSLELLIELCEARVAGSSLHAEANLHLFKEYENQPSKALKRLSCVLAPFQALSETHVHTYLNKSIGQWLTFVQHSTHSELFRRTVQQLKIAIRNVRARRWVINKLVPMLQERELYDRVEEIYSRFPACTPLATLRNCYSDE